MHARLGPNLYSNKLDVSPPILIEQLRPTRLFEIQKQRCLGCVVLCCVVLCLSHADVGSYLLPCLYMDSSKTGDSVLEDSR